MPQGTVKKVVWLSTQSPRLENNDLNPSRNTTGYGYITTEEGSEIFFDLKSLEDVNFGKVREGDLVEYEPDGNTGCAKAVRPAVKPAGATGAPQTASA